MQGAQPATPRVCASTRTRAGNFAHTHLSASPPRSDKGHGGYLQLGPVRYDRDSFERIPALLGRMQRQLEIRHGHHDAVRLASRLPLPIFLPQWLC